MYFVYLIQCADNTLYTGITTDILRRFEEHKNGKGAHYTKVRGVKKLLYTEECPDRSSALRREATIKKLRRGEKLLLKNMTT